jgi:hypothetical protein
MDGSVTSPDEVPRFNTGLDFLQLDGDSLWTPKGSGTSATTAAGSSDHEYAPFVPSVSFNATTPLGVSPDNGSSPSMIWRPDEFMLSQDFLTYREELRSLIFSTAQSAAPTREGSPAAIDEANLTLDLHPDDIQGRRATAQILSVGKRVHYLRNYVQQVAPWVCSP